MKTPGIIKHRLQAIHVHWLKKQWAPHYQQLPREIQKELQTRWHTYNTVGFKHLEQRWPGLFRFEKYVKLLPYIQLLEKAEIERLQNPDSYTQKGTALLNFGHLGDLMHSIPLAKAIKNEQPHTPLILLCGPGNKSIAQRYALFDHIITLNPNLDMVRPEKNTDVPETWLELKKNKIHTLVTTGNTHFLEFIVARILAPKRWIGAGESCSIFPDMPGQELYPYDANAYEAARLLNLAHQSGLVKTPLKPQLDFPVMPEERASIWEKIGPKNNPYAVLVPGAGWSGKQWSPNRYRSVALHLQQDRGFRVFVCGSPEERTLGEVVAGKEGVNLAGKISLGEFGALLEEATLFIGNDSGPMHMAGALEVPSVLLFGPTSPKKWAPQGDKVRVVQVGSGCGGCFPWHPNATCIHENRCMRGIEIGKVLEKIDEVL